LATPDHLGKGGQGLRPVANKGRETFVNCGLIRERGSSATSRSSRKNLRKHRWERRVSDVGRWWRRGKSLPQRAGPRRRSAVPFYIGRKQSAMRQSSRRSACPARITRPRMQWPRNWSEAAEKKAGSPARPFADACGGLTPALMSARLSRKSGPWTGAVDGRGSRSPQIVGFVGVCELGLCSRGIYAFQ